MVTATVTVYRIKSLDIKKLYVTSVGPYDTYEYIRNMF